MNSGGWNNIKELKTEHVKGKIVISGDVVEVYKYTKGYKKGFAKCSLEGSGGRKSDYKSESYTENREKVLNRAKRDLRRLINANNNAYGSEFTTKFLTLTFKKNVVDLDYAHGEFKKFILRLNYAVFKVKRSVLMYTCVVEFQKRGAIHYHLVLYNMPWFDVNEIAKIWGHGFVKINKCEEVDNLGAYVTKYMSKDNGDKRLEGRKCYFNSRGLIKPTEITEEKQVEAIAEALPVQNLAYASEFDNEYLGNISYKQYNLKRLISKGP